MSEKQNIDDIEEEYKAAKPAISSYLVSTQKSTANSENYLEWCFSQATSTTTRMLTAIFVISIFVIGYFTLMICLGIYAYANPDPKTAFYIDGVDSVALSLEVITASALKFGVKVRPGYPIDMAVLFRSWFLWGFWGCVFQISILAAIIPLCFVIKEHIKVLNITTLIL